MKNIRIALLKSLFFKISLVVYVMHRSFICRNTSFSLFSLNRNKVFPRSEWLDGKSAPQRNGDGRYEAFLAWRSAEKHAGRFAKLKASTLPTVREQAMKDRSRD